MLKFREKWTAPNGTFKLERGENKQKLAKKWFISNDNISVNNGAISILIRFLKSAWKTLLPVLSLFLIISTPLLRKLTSKLANFRKRTIFGKMQVNDWVSWTGYEGDWKVKIGKYIQEGMLTVARVLLWLINEFIHNSWNVRQEILAIISKHLKLICRRAETTDDSWRESNDGWGFEWSCLRPWRHNKLIISWMSSHQLSDGLLT